MRRAIAGTGQALVTLGLLILLFVAYQLWGTGIFTARAQENLKSKFQHELEQYNADIPLVAPSTTKKPTPGKTTPTTLRGDKPSPSPPTPAEQAGLAQGLSGQSKSLGPSIFFGFLAALVGLTWWWSFRRWRHPFTWFIGITPFLIALFPFYVYLERALPSGY